MYIFVLPELWVPLSGASHKMVAAGWSQCKTVAEEIAVFSPKCLINGLLWILSGLLYALPACPGC